MTAPVPAASPRGSATLGAGVLSAGDQAVLWEMEERFWTGGADMARATTAADAVMILPYPPGILRGDQVWKHADGWAGWRSVVMTDRRATRLGTVALLAYRVSAEKPDAPFHEGRCASVYLQDDGRWVRIAHRQTPVGHEAPTSRGSHPDRRPA